MNAILKRTSLLLAPALALSLSVAVQAGGDTRSTASPPSTTAGARTEAGKMSTASGTSMRSPTTGDIRASKLIGKNVTNPQGESLGEIKDLVIDTTNGNVQYAVISFGGFLGLGDKLFAYPLEKFQRATGDDRGKLVLDVDKEKLKSAPGFADKDWPNFNMADYRAQIDRFYGTRPSAAKVRFGRASQIIAGDVKDVRNNDIGDIEDIVVNLPGGQVHYVVLKFDRAWTPNNKLVAMPLKALKSEDGDGTDLVYQASREQLKSAPSFEKDRWPVAGDARFRADVDRYAQTWINNPAARPEHPQRSTTTPR